MDASGQSRPTHIALPPRPFFPPPPSSPSLNDDPNGVLSPFLPFYTAPSTPSADSPLSSPALTDYFTPPTSPSKDSPTSVDPQPPPQWPQTSLAAAHPASSYVSPSPYGTDDVYPGIPTDVTNDFILDDGSLTALEKIFLFCRSQQVVHRVYIVSNMPRLLKQVVPSEAVEYILPLFRELVLDKDDSVQEEFGRSLGDVMWWFITSCRVVEIVTDRTALDDDREVCSPVQIHYQTFTPLFGSLLLSNNVLVSEVARNSVLLILERIKKADDKDSLARGDHVRGTLPPDNLWQAPTSDYAIDDPEIEEEEPELGYFGPDERACIKHEILAAIVIALGRLDHLSQDGGPEDMPAIGGPRVEERRLWLQSQSGDGVQVVLPDGSKNVENGVTTLTDLEASSSNITIKEATINSYFPIVPSLYSTPSSTSSTSSSSNSSSGSSPTAPPVAVSPSSPLAAPENSILHQSSPCASDDTVCLQVPSTIDHQQCTPTSDSSTMSPQASPLEYDQIPSFLQREKSRPRESPLTYSLSPGPTEHGENSFYDEQVTSGRWSTMRLIAAVASNGTADLETEIYFIKDVYRSVQDPVFWVRREAAFAIGALARVVPEDFVCKDLVPMFERLVNDPHSDVRQNVLFSLPPLIQRLSPEHRRKVTHETLTTLCEDPEIDVRQSALDTLSETIYAFANDPQGPPEFLLRMYLGRKEDKIVRNGTRLITFEIPPPLEAFYLDTKRPLTLAFGFPAVTLTLGQERWSELREAYLDLAANRMNDVNRALAAGMGDIAKIIGPENTRQDLIEVWWKFINFPKDSETRIHAIENMEALITTAGKETGLSFWEGVSKNWEAKIFKVWRERKIILEEMMKMPDLLGHEILPIVGAIQALALVDLEQGVRDIAISFLPRVQGLLSPHPNLLDGLNTAVSQLLSSTFRRRSTYDVPVQLALNMYVFTSRFDSQKPSMALTDNMLRTMLELSQDSVIDVKISVARFVNSVYGKFKRELTEPIPALLVDILRRLSQDSSPSVKMYIPESAALLGGIPAHGKPAPAVFSQPTRSRHFSKPPLSQFDDQLSIDGYEH